MDYVTWCVHLLAAMDNSLETMPERDTIGLHRSEIVDACAIPGSKVDEAIVHDTLMALSSVGLVANNRSMHYWRLTPAGSDHVIDPIPLWEDLCSIRLRGDQRDVLHMVNKLGIVQHVSHADRQKVSHDDMLTALAWADFDRFYAAARALSDRGLVGLAAFLGNQAEINPTYAGVVWEQRRGHTFEARLIDQTIAEGETTSVDFKREINTKSEAQKAKLVKTIIGLANTQASGRRWIIVGFDDKTRQYHGPTANDVSHEQIEQILAAYTEPIINVRYDIVDYRGLPVGKLEVLRSPADLPYRTSRAVWKLRAHQVFVRHGSLTEEPTPAELDALTGEALRAKQMTREP